MNEEGVTLVEMLMAVLLTGTLITIVLGVLTTFSQVETNNQSTYAELDQLLPVGTSFQHLLRSAVSSAPITSAGVPTPPFGTYATGVLTSTSIGSTKLTFFTNTARTSKTTGKLLGPTKVTAFLKCPKTTPKPAKTRTCTFKVVTYTALPNTCPGLTKLTSPPTVPCAWTTKSHILFTVGDVNIWTTTTDTTKPVFSYYLAGKTSAETLSGHPFASCTGSTVTKCPADHIQSVKVEVEVATPQALRRGHVTKVEDQTVTYQLSVISQTYTAAVG